MRWQAKPTISCCQPNLRNGIHTTRIRETSFNIKALTVVGASLGHLLL